MCKDHTEATVTLSQRAMHSEQFLFSALTRHRYTSPKPQVSSFGYAGLCIPACNPSHFPGTASLAVQAVSSLFLHFRDHLVFPSSDLPQGCLCLA